MPVADSVPAGKITTIDLMNALHQMDKATGESRTRTETLLEGIAKRLDDSERKLDGLTVAFNEQQAYNKITREMVATLQTQKEDHETRLRDTEKKANGMGEIQRDLMELKHNFERLSEQNEQAHKEKDRLIHELERKVYMVLGGAVVSEILLYVILEFVLRPALGW